MKKTDLLEEKNTVSNAMQYVATPTTKAIGGASAVVPVGNVKKEITVKPKINYGDEICYPACEFSKLICEITARKGVSSKAMELLAKAGYKIKYIAVEESTFLDNLGGKRI
jgi:hypothetical protein